MNNGAIKRVLQYEYKGYKLTMYVKLSFVDWCRKEQRGGGRDIILRTHWRVVVYLTTKFVVLLMFALIHRPIVAARDQLAGA